MNEFTLVRHSAYAEAGNPDFEDAVEARELTREQAYKVRAAGGVLFPTREAAEQAVPNARGSFSSLRIGSAEIHVPKPKIADPF
jgi:hypothetical protein